MVSPVAILHVLTDTDVCDQPDYPDPCLINGFLLNGSINPTGSKEPGLDPGGASPMYITSKKLYTWFMTTSVHGTLSTLLVIVRENYLSLYENAFCLTGPL